jgi:thioredoxin-related protein
MDAYATWCAPCKKMDKDVYSDKSVGDIINSQFISVRLQVDKTDNDNDDIQKWYSIAQKLNEQFGIDAYPSFLFFAPDGNLAYKAFGLRDVTGFIKLVNDALTNPNAKYQILIRKFNDGQLEYSEMPNLATKAKEKRDNRIANEIVKKYKEKYMDRLSNNDAFTKENLLLVAENYFLLNSKDRYFNFFYSNPDSADLIINRKILGHREKIANKVVREIIEKEEINDKIYKDGKPITLQKPNWSKIRKIIIKKYGNQWMDYIDHDNSDFCIDYYFAAKDWKNYVKYVNKRLQKYPPDRNGKNFGPFMGDEFQLNHYAWWLFKSCNDKRCLKKALPWIDLAISWANDSGKVSDDIDTKANLLYRIGRKKEAITLEERAIESCKQDEFRHKNYEKVLEKMKEGLPTWSEN